MPTRQNSSLDILYFVAFAVITFLIRAMGKRKSEAQKQEKEKQYVSKADVLEEVVKKEVNEFEKEPHFSNSFLALKPQNPSQQLRDHHLKGGDFFEEKKQDNFVDIEKLMGRVSLQEIVVLSEIYNNPYI